MCIYLSRTGKASFVWLVLQNIMLRLSLVDAIGTTRRFCGRRRRLDTAPNGSRLAKKPAGHPFSVAIVTIAANCFGIHEGLEVFYKMGAMNLLTDGINLRLGTIARHVRRRRDSVEPRKKDPQKCPLRSMFEIYKRYWPKRSFLRFRPARCSFWSCRKIQ